VGFGHLNSNVHFSI